MLRRCHRVSLWSGLVLGVLAGVMFGEILRFSPAYEVAQAPVLRSALLSDVTRWEPSQEDEDLAWRKAVSRGDAHTAYLDRKAFSVLRQTISGDFVGLGARIKPVPEGLRIVEVLAQSPAAEARLCVGEVVLALNEMPAEVLGVDGFVAELHRHYADGVHLRVRGINGVERLVETGVKRMMLPSVSEVRVCAPGIAYVRAVRFQQESPKEWCRVLRRVEADRFEGLVIDLRGNPGGSLPAALECAQLYRPEGELLLSTFDLDEQQAYAYYSESPMRPRPYRIVLLVDGQTASAAEVLAGCWQQSGVATVIGQPTFGKGSVQGLIVLPNGEGAKYTRAWYALADGRFLEGQGVIPNVVVYPEAQNDRALAEAIALLSEEP